LFGNKGKKPEDEELKEMTRSEGFADGVKIGQVDQ